MVASSTAQLAWAGQQSSCLIWKRTYHISNFECPRIFFLMLLGERREERRIHINDQLQVGDSSLLFYTNRSVEKEACILLLLFFNFDGWLLWAGVWLYFRLSLVMCRAVQWPVCQQTSATQLWSKLNTRSCLRLWCSLHSGLKWELVRDVFALSSSAIHWTQIILCK